MRRVAALLAVAGGILPALAVSAPAPAYACAQPQEGEPNCCPAPALLTVTVAGHDVSVPDPTWDPRRCE